jgi:UDP-glucose 4-epimerase
MPGRTFALVPQRERVVVTGGAGFIGSHLVDALLDGDVAQVTVVDSFFRGRRENLADRQHDPRLRIVEADVRDLDELRSAMRGATLVYHLAAHSGVMRAATLLDYTFGTNVSGTYNVLRAAEEQGVRQVIFTSSREVYGEPVSLPVHESHPLLSINSYGASKVAGEAMCRAFGRERGLEATVLRLTNVYGGRDSGRVISHWIREARDGRDLIVYGAEKIIDFVWIGDVIRALLRAAEADLKLPPINVASGTGTKIVDLARRIARLSGSRAEIRIEPCRSIEVVRFVGGTDRMARLLGVEPALDPLSHLSGMVRSLVGEVA